MFRRRQFQPKTASDSIGESSALRDSKEDEPLGEKSRDRAVGFHFQEVGIVSNRAKNPIVFLDVSIGGSEARLTFELRKDIVPRTAENFRSICAGDRAEMDDGTRLTYQGCVFHRVIKDFAVIGGDIARHDGTGRVSVYGGPFADENFVLRHVGPGVLTCCNAGPDTNSSTFMITTVEAPWLNGRSVAFGCLANAESFEALDRIEGCGAEGGRPSVYIQASVFAFLKELVNIEEELTTSARRQGARFNSGFLAVQDFGHNNLRTCGLQEFQADSPRALLTSGQRGGSISVNFALNAWAE